MAGEHNIVRVSNVVKSFKLGSNEVRALKGVDLTVRSGHYLSIMGPSGSGKSTLFNMIGGLDKPSSGQVFIDEVDISQLDAYELAWLRCRKIGYIFQTFNLIPVMTALENVTLPMTFAGMSADAATEKGIHLLEIVGLGERFRHKPSELSGGQQQRVGVARALSADPEILLMDEPFGAIDPINRDQIQDEFMRLQSRLKKTVAFVSHDIHEAIKMADRIATFRGGQLIQYDTPEVILTQPRNKFVSDFVGADRALKVLGLIRARDAMNPEPANLIDGNMPSPEALNLLVEKNRKTGIVIRQDKPVGYVTPKLLKFEKGPAADVAEPFQVFVEDDEPLRDVLSSMLMDSMDFYCVVDDGGRFKGTINYRDIQNKILELYDDDAN